MTTKSKKELAFIRDFHLTGDWTERFTHLADEHLDLPSKGKFLYAESGTGSHVLVLREKAKEKLEIFAVENDAESLKIARAKAVTLNAKINFQQAAPDDIKFETAEFDTVLGDVTFIERGDLPAVLAEFGRVSKNKVAFFLPTAGSYGEFFSIFWETLFNAGLITQGAMVESLIANQITVSEAEEMAANAGLKEVESWTSLEIYEYETGAEFIASPLIKDFLLPRWTAGLPDNIRQKIIKSVAKTIDSERDGLSFRLSVKATFVSGGK